ncbi:uncharacterized protein BO97DRAFT_384555 [Aspergillus homomorphus CBS 101889]|uniref:Uncharacterized protein n=1 Tax=Aspergillus homomorphus (strain CBS 101889) TaxID=1450537 RepID=A0A395I6L5_ASPHC|nr:hypothetical protein BO97DRAFT_384555 [Aspergillus homomorphus CBS 101889]RAL15419.1 hypothetical protein BO97DRAFT_384555 [Aspergillus homomorphus CBS 101889]
MSSVVKYVSSCSRATSLRAAQLFNSRPWPKVPYYNGGFFFSPCPTLTLTSSTLRLGSSIRSIRTASRLESAHYGPDHGDQYESVHQSSHDPASPEFWRLLRLQSPFNRSFVERNPDPEEQKKEPTEPEVSSAATGGVSSIRKEEKFVYEERGYDQDVDDTSNHPKTNSALQSSPIPYSRRLVKRRQPVINERIDPRRRPKNSHAKNKNPELTPNEYLLLVLQRAHPRHGTKSHNWACIEGNEDFLITVSQEAIDHYKHFHRPSLQEIVADYIQQVDSHLDSVDVPLLDPNLDDESRSRYSGRLTQLTKGLEDIFCEENVDLLASRGYTVADVVTWAWVLKSTTPYEACLRILSLEIEQSGALNRPSKKVPPFIPLLLLRQGLDLKTFRLLLVYSLDHMTGQSFRVPDTTTQDPATQTAFNEKGSFNPVDQLIDPNTCATLVVRLLHHARELWPQAQLSIAQGWAFYMNALNTGGRVCNGEIKGIHQLLADKCNTLLRALSLPCRRDPFHSASIQQRSQFELLRAMARHQPVLPVTERGYQSLVTVQLAHKKTDAERQSAELKAPSWPPWKEDKIGYDVDRGVEGMKSRAMRVLAQKVEVGYSSSAWENMSRILAGWDTDGSPTIQTRSLALSRPEILRHVSMHSDHYKLWEARIRATRTVREAWACFLAYHNRMLPVHGAIYAAMGEKLIYSKTSKSRHSTALPGDGREVFPEPSSARDWIYVPSEPPDLHGFLHLMLSKGIRPRGRFLAALLQHAPSYESGLGYLCCSTLTDEQLGALCTVWGRNSPPSWLKPALNELPGYIMSAFVAFLCKYCGSHLTLSKVETLSNDLFPIKFGPRTYHVQTLFSHAKEMLANPRFRYYWALPHAMKLLRTRDSPDPKAWVHVLSAVLDHPVYTVPGKAQPLVAWYEVQALTTWMEQCQIDTGLDGFRVLCNGFSRVMNMKMRSSDSAGMSVAVVRFMAQRRFLPFFDRVPQEFEGVKHNALDFLKRRFDMCVLGDPVTSDFYEHNSSSIQGATDSRVVLPPMVLVPSPADLHAFVRVLGFARDMDGLSSLLRWIKKHEFPLKEKYDEHLNGGRMMRRVVVAFRVMLERRWNGQTPWIRGDLNWDPYGQEYDEPDEMDYTSPRLQEAYDIVSSSQVLGPWPSISEARHYCFAHPGQTKGQH